MALDTRPRGIAWKERRARGWLLAVSCMLVIAGGTLAFLSKDEWPLPMALALCAPLLGLTLFFAEEHDPARSFLYTLPISRRRILWEKLRAILRQWLGLSVISLLLVVGLAIEFQGKPLDWPFAYVCCAAVLGVPVLLLVALFAFHVHSVVVSLIIGAAFSFVTAGIMLSNTVGPDPALVLNWPRLLTQAATATALLAAWFFFLFTRTALQELGPTARMMLALLFGVACIEVFFTLFMTGWRDLVFLVFGV